jgi:hypothetical protein
MAFKYIYDLTVVRVLFAGENELKRTSHTDVGRIKIHGGKNYDY